MSHAATMPAEMIPIRTFEFTAGLLHLLRDASLPSDEDVAAQYEHKGKLLSVRDGQMGAARFYALDDFNDL